MTTNTRYGLVNIAALNKLREEFDTSSILDVIEKLDEIRFHIDSVRDEMLKLHGMAHDLINGAGSANQQQDQPIWESSEAISMTIWELPDHLEFIRESMGRFQNIV